MFGLCWYFVINSLAVVCESPFQLLSFILSFVCALNALILLLVLFEEKLVGKHINKLCLKKLQNFLFNFKLTIESNEVRTIHWAQWLAFNLREPLIDFFRKHKPSCFVFFLLFLLCIHLLLHCNCIKPSHVCRKLFYTTLSVFHN